MSQVKQVFDESPFYVPSSSVTLMNGTHEGIKASFFTAFRHYINFFQNNAAIDTWLFALYNFKPESRTTTLRQYSLLWKP